MSSPPRPVDLVVVIDTSQSMQDVAVELSTLAEAAIQAAVESCPSDVRVAWLGIEGHWPATAFQQSYREYLQALGVADADLVGPQTGAHDDREEGAAAIEDLSRHFNWRAGAVRALLYLGDEALRGGNPQDADDAAAADAAIAAATGQGVLVFTYFGSPDEVETADEYARVASETGGQAFVAPAGSIGGFQAVLQEIVCAAAEEEPPDIPTDPGDGQGYGTGCRCCCCRTPERGRRPRVVRESASRPPAEGPAAEPTYSVVSRDAAVNAARQRYGAQASSDVVLELLIRQMSRRGLRLVQVDGELLAWEGHQPIQQLLSPRLARR